MKNALRKKRLSLYNLLPSSCIFLKIPNVRLSLLILLLSSTVICRSQNPERFQSEYTTFEKLDSVTLAEKGSLDTDHLFVGSSSIRFWLSLKEDYPDKDVLNRGFGGSHMSDLLTKREALIAKYNPQKIFIYEGDNDIADGEHTIEIAYETEQLLNYVFQILPDTDVYLIAAKPSILRWQYKEDYIQLNREYLKLSLRNPQVHYIDVWSAMVDDHGEVYPNIFIDDQLHMNARGYKIWKKVVGPYLYE